MKKFLVRLFVSLCCIALLSSVALAISPQFNVSSKGNDGLVFELKPGSSIQQDLQILNMDSSRIIDVAFEIDKSSSNDGTSNAQFPSDWIKLSSPSLIINPNEEKSTGFTITVPKEAKDGDYVIRLISKITNAYDKALNSSNKSSGVNISTAIGKKIKLKVNSDLSTPNVGKEVAVVIPEKSDGISWASFVNWFSSMNPIYVEVVLAILVLLLLVKMYIHKKDTEIKKKK